MLVVIVTVASHGILFMFIFVYDYVTPHNCYELDETAYAVVGDR